jgi:hypothetical protein
MTRYYHARFFADTRFTLVAVVSLLVVGSWAVPEAFLLVPVLALVGANQTAFDASYLYMARHYAAALEEEINAAMRRRMLVGADLEDCYLVPLHSKKLVGAGFGRDFTWFSWMTLFYTSLGALVYMAGVWLSWGVLEGFARAAYLIGLGALTALSVGVGWWWFVRGTGEDRLQEVIRTRFGSRVDTGVNEVSRTR